MAKLPRADRSSSMVLHTAGVAWALVVVAAGGCAGGKFYAANLPAEYQIPSTANIEAIGLTHLEHCPVNSQLIARGDVLEVTIITDYGNMSTMTAPARVGEDGTANIPLIGKVALAGLELDEAEQSIAAEGVARRVFQRPHVVVTMERKRMNKVTVIGAVNQPAVIELPRDSSSLLAALVRAGGLTADAGSDVEIRRSIPRDAAPGLPAQRLADGTLVRPAGYEWAQSSPRHHVQITRVNLASAAIEGRGGRMLDDGDVVVVTRRVPKPIYVMGLVAKPGEYEVPPNQDMYLLDALATAGDRTMQIADKVVVIRRIPGRPQPVIIESSIRQAKKDGAANLRLAPGDIVSVEETPATVMLDVLRSFLRFGATVPLF